VNVAAEPLSSAPPEELDELEEPDPPDAGGLLLLEQAAPRAKVKTARVKGAAAPTLEATILEACMVHPPAVTHVL
jgi:hypothetical protein